MRDERRRWLSYEVVRRKARGESERAIGRGLRIARKTVKRILNEQKQRREDGEHVLERELPRVRAPRPSKLDPYQEQIAAWLEQFPELTAVRLREKLEELGFTGGYTICRAYLQAHKKTKTAARAVQIVETVIGQQAQFDWSPYVLEGGLKVQLWGYTLSWSRGRSLRASDNTRQSTILRCLTESFEELGGVPGECVTDSMPGVVDRWECDRPILNVRFVDYAAYYDFAAHIAPRGDGAYKGKVERGFRDVDESLLNGRRFHSVEEFCETLAWWVRERVMKRPHPKTGRPRIDMLREEQLHLKPLPRHPYDTRDVVIRLVESTAYVQYEGNFYLAPEPQMGELVYVCASAERVEIFDRGVHRLAEHARLPDGAGQHLPDPRRRNRGRYDTDLLTERFIAWGPAAEDFARRLRKQKRFPGPELSYLLGLQLRWSADDIVKALAHAARYQAYDAHAVERILESRFAPRTLSEQIADATRARIREVMRENPVSQRPIGSYTTLQRGDPITQPQEMLDAQEDTTTAQADAGRGPGDKDPTE